MKKLIPLLFTIFLLLSPFQPVKAATFAGTISAPSQITAGQEFAVTVGVANVTNMYGFSATFTYESSKASIVSSTGLNGFTLTLGTKIVVDKATPKSGSFSIATIVFKAKTTFVVGQTALFSLKDIQYSNGTSDINDTATRSDSVKMVSNNTYLKTLTVSNGSLSFNKSTSDYNVVVENSVSSIQIGATPEDNRSSVSGTGTKSLSIYNNTFSIIVTAENGSKRTYTLNIQRKDANGLAAPPSTNNNLKEIHIEGFDVFNLAFSKDQLEYTLEVGNLVTDLTLTASAEDSKSDVKINKAPLIVGPNTITIVVTSESGSVKTYTITVNRSSDVPTVDEDEIIDALTNATTPTIGLNAPLNGQISIAILDALKSSQKTLVVVYKVEGKTMYEWRIDGSKITNSTIINTLVLFDSEDKAAIEKLTNYAKGILLNLEENASLPDNTSLRLYVSSMYKDGDKVTLYYYDKAQDKLSISSKDLVVENGQVEFELDHTSTYFLSQTQAKTVGILDYLFVIVSILEACIIVLLILFKRRPRKAQSDLSMN
jgi:3-dehydroquinate dehydratase